MHTEVDQGAAARFFLHGKPLADARDAAVSFPTAFCAVYFPDVSFLNDPFDLSGLIGKAIVNTDQDFFAALFLCTYNFFDFFGI